MKNRYCEIVLSVFFLIFFSACDKDNKYIGNKRWVTIATVENLERKASFFFTQDNHIKLWITDSNFPNYRPKDGQRIIADYIIFDDKSAKGNHDHEVKLKDVHEVLTKDLIVINEFNKDGIGNDPIDIQNVWISNDFLNIEFIFPGYNKVHFVNLGLNETKDYNDGKIHLEFRHNSNKDVSKYRSWGIASFRINSLRNSGRDSVSIVLHSKPLDSIKERMHELTYTFNDTDTELRIIKLDQDKGRAE